jgi:hypothetical protein
LQLVHNEYTLTRNVLQQPQGIVTSLSNNNNNNNNIHNKLTIQEIGQETLEREMSREKQTKIDPSNVDKPTKIDSPNVENPTKIKVQVEHHFPHVASKSTKSDSTVESSSNVTSSYKTTSTTSSPSTKIFTDEIKVHAKEMSKQNVSPSTKFVETPSKVSVRHVPIRLDDGKVIQRDPDEKMEIR